jgi:hypothetical protein
MPIERRESLSRARDTLTDCRELRSNFYDTLMGPSESRKTATERLKYASQPRSIAVYPRTIQRKPLPNDNEPLPIAS